MGFLSVNAPSKHTLQIETSSSFKSSRSTFNVFVDDDAECLEHELKSKRNEEDLMLRIGVDAGGCSGFSYQFEFTTSAEVEEDDLVLTHDDAKFVIDKISLKFVRIGPQ